MKWLQNGNLAKLVAFFVIAVIITCTVSFAANGWQSFINEPTTDNQSVSSDIQSDNSQGSADNVTEDVPAILPDPKYYHPITGLETDLETSLKRPICLTLDSSNPLYGISSSYLTIEFPTEYGNTRFLCFTDEATRLGKLGSISPSRGYISNFAVYFGGILLSYGFDDSFEYPHFELTNNIDLAETSGYCYTEYNSFVYTNGDLVNACMNNSKINQNAQEALHLPYMLIENDSQAQLNGETVYSISVPYCESNVTQLTYVSAEKCYTLSKNSATKNDLLNDKSLRYDNVFILYTDSTTYETENNTQLVIDTYSSGNGIYASAGEYVEIVWTKDASGNLVFYDIEGNRLTVNRGTSYIACVKSSLKSSVKIS